MDISKVFNVNVDSVEVLIAPEDLRKQLPLSEKAFQTVMNGRKAIEDILDGQDKRHFVVVGPCSIHDPQAAIEYATSHETALATMQSAHDRFAADALSLGDATLQPEVELAADLIALIEENAPQGNFYPR